MMLLLLAVHICPVPAAAYRVVERAHLSQRDQRTLERYTMCVCGPDGANDGPQVPDGHGRYAYNPTGACERSGWNGHRYKGVR
jgi:hypothetical protein